jgi:hypothetical protein
MLCAAALAGCGSADSDSTSATITPGSPVVAKSDGSYSNAPAITKALVREWPARWCGVQIGDSRDDVTRKMGAYPTEQDSHKIPLIPPIRHGESTAPPEPAGSDTWEAPGSYQFNAFFDTSLRVQQLDFSGPSRSLPCSLIRVG